MIAATVDWIATNAGFAENLPVTPFEDFVTEALKDPLGDPTAPPIPVKLPNVRDAVDEVKNFLKGGGTSGLEAAVRRGIEAFLKVFPKLDDDDSRKILEEFIERVVKVLVEAIAELVRAVSDSLKDASSDIATALKVLLTKLLDKLLSEIQKSGVLENVLRGPLDVVRALQKFRELLDALGRFPQIERRIEAVGNSLNELFALIASSDDEDQNGLHLFQQAFTGISTTLLSVLKSSESPEKVVVRILQDIVFPREVIPKILHAISKFQLWKWAEFPGGMPAGKLNLWLNNPGKYKDIELEREFRVRLISAFDAYLRNRLEQRILPSPQTRSDERLAPALIGDVLCVFFETVITFALEPECYPIDDLDVDGFEDVGAKVSGFLSRQVRVSLRATIGTLLRGAWEWSVHSEALAELVASLISSIFSSILEGLIRNITFSVQVVSCYPNSPTNGSVVHEWSSLEAIANSTDPKDRLKYVAVVRDPLGVDLNAVKGALGDPNDNDNFLGGIVRDLGAYLDVSYRRFKIESRFPPISRVDDITITRAELVGKKLIVWATTSAKFERPIPVLRAYVCCRIAVLRPGATPADRYVLELELDSAPRCLELVVLSNRGGLARTRVYLP